MTKDIKYFSEHKFVQVYFNISRQIPSLAFGFRCGADSDLSDGAVFPEDVVHFFGRDFVGQISDVQNSIHFRRQSDLGTILRLHRHLPKFFCSVFCFFLMALLFLLLENLVNCLKSSSFSSKI